MSKHTTGPWRTNGEGIFRDWPGGVVQVAHCGRPVDGDQGANAKLIAAAPDMLEALKAILFGLPSGDAWMPEQKAREALAKAQGDTE